MRTIVTIAIILSLSVVAFLALEKDTDVQRAPAIAADNPRVKSIDTATAQAGPLAKDGPGSADMDARQQEVASHLPAKSNVPESYNEGADNKGPAAHQESYPSPEQMARALHYAFMNDKASTLDKLDSVMKIESDSGYRLAGQEEAVRDALAAAIREGQVDDSALRALSAVECYPSLCRLTYANNLQSPPLMQQALRRKLGFPIILATPTRGDARGWNMFAVTENMVFHMTPTTDQ